MPRIPAPSCARFKSFFLGFTLALAILGTSARFSAAEKLSYSITLPKEEIKIEHSEGRDWVAVRAKGYVPLSQAGAPELPYRIVNVLLPQGEVVSSYRFPAGPEVVLKRDTKLPRAPSPISGDGKAGGGQLLVEAGEGMFPGETGRYLGTGYWHGRGIASFAIFPLRLRDGALVLNESVGVEIETEAPETDLGVVVRERYRERREEQLTNRFDDWVINPEMNLRYAFDQVRQPRSEGGFRPTSYPSLEGSAVDYVIITSDLLAWTYQRLADWKTSKGVPTVVRTVSWIEANTRNGVDLPETIRFFIRDAYARWGIRFVLLGGDSDILPPRYALSRYYLGGTEHPADMYFGCIDGSWNDDHDPFFGEVPEDNPDLFAEVYTGRIPVSDVAATNVMVDKIIGYEKPETPGYQDRLLLLSEVLFPASWPNPPVISLNGADFSELIIAAALAGEPVDVTRMYESNALFSGSVPLSRQAALDSLNVGFNHALHTGHGWRFNMSVGDGSIVNSDADALSNSGKWTNVVSFAATAAFDFDCIAEHFLRNPNGGAVSFVGGNEMLFPNVHFNYVGEYYKLLFRNDAVHIGEAFARSRLPRTPTAAAGDNVDLFQHYVYTLLADPEMPLFTGPVGTLDVTHIPAVGLGQNSILVTVSSGGQPVDSAVVCLSKGDDDYQFRATDAAGNATIDFTTESAGSIRVVVTGLNVARHQGHIIVNPSAAAYVNFDGLVVDDDLWGGSFGNGDGFVDAGETIDFTLSLKNTGSLPSDSVSFALRSDNPSVTVLDSIGEVGVISGGGMRAAADPARVALDPALADGAVVAFQLEMRDASGGLWIDTFERVVRAPVLDALALRVDDSPPLGNGDGVIDPNEEFRLHYELKNYGTGKVSSLVGELEDLSGVFVFIDSTDTWADLDPFEAGENLTGFHIVETNTSSENALRIAITDLFGRVREDTFELRAPEPPTGIAFLPKPDSLKLTWTASVSPDVVHYDVHRSLVSGGPYEKINVDPLEHTVFADKGLTGLTDYFYVLTAVDASGNQSPFSAEVPATTNPIQAPGFPIELLIRSPSTPAVGDLDGDGDLEIVVGNQQIYAWHHDGLELRDGDGNPFTSGVLNTLGGPFFGGIALARMDATSGLEIIAADMGSEDPNNIGTRSVYVVNFNGDLLPGWPKQGEFGFRATPVAADIDGDNIFEVLAVDDFGALYVWRADGSEYRDGDSNPATDGIFFRPTPIGTTYMSPAVCDLDGDGLNEIILATREGIVYALNEDGSSVAGWPFVMPSESVGSPVIGDIDGDGLPEVVVRAKTAQVYVLNHDATTINLGWPRFVAINNPFFAASPALADFDNDGKLEIVLTHDNSAEGRVYVINHLGIDLPGWPLTYSTSNFGFTESTPTVADIDGDGSLDIVLGSETGFINAWDISGNLKAGFPIQSGDAIRATPFIGDIDGDLDVDLVVNSWDQSIYMYDMVSPYNPSLAPWPTLAGNVQRTGKFGFTVATGIGRAAFSFALEGDGIQLTWRFGAVDGSHYDIARSLVGDDGEPGEFVGVASKLTTDNFGDLRFADTTVEMGERYVYRLSSVEEPGEVFTTHAIYVPISRAELTQNYPNPFNPTTRIVYFVPEGAPRHVSLVVYDVTGARVRTLVNGRQEGGRYDVVWNGRDHRGNQAATGVYFCRLTAPGFTKTRKMVLLQ